MYPLSIVAMKMLQYWILLSRKEYKEYKGRKAIKDRLVHKAHKGIPDITSHLPYQPKGFFHGRITGI